jgi:hypothetical protein
MGRRLSLTAAARLSKSNQRLWPLGMPFGVYIDLITNYIHGQFGGICFAPQVPPAPRCTPVVYFYQTDFPPLSRAPCCAGQPSFGHTQAAPRWALLPLDSIRRRSSQAKITDLTAARKPKALKKPSRHEACTPTKRAPRRDENLHLADCHRHTATPLGPVVNPSYSGW